MSGPVVVLSGGVGGAKLVLGLSRVLPPGALTVVANTGDDFEHLGFQVSPDIDTLLYTLSGLADPTQGWGRRDETWNFMAALGGLGGETWFRLGDGDLAMHVERTRRLAAGEPLSTITAAFADRLGIATRILPMTDDVVRTRVRTPEGWLDFQDYFVRRRCEPTVHELAFSGAATARALPDVLDALRDPALRALVIAPSNPYLSVDPILAIAELRAAVRNCRAPVIAVSPIIAGQAVKGPTAKMMRELGREPGVPEVARHYAGLVDVLVIDDADAASVPPAGLRFVTAPTLMRSLQDRERLAAAVLAAAQSLTEFNPQRTGT